MCVGLYDCFFFTSSMFCSSFRGTKQSYLLGFGWQIILGSFLNKLIILPFAFDLSYFVPWLITVVLILGAFYLAFEAAEKIYEYVVPHPKAISEVDGISLSPEELVIQEKAKIKAAIVTDFILSVEIVIIALGTVLEKTITTQIIVVSIIAILATVGVYGIVAAIVRMDDLGLVMTKRKSKTSQTIGKLLIQTLPLVIKGLAFVGTVALVLVSGGIFVHNIEFVHHALEGLPSIVGEFLAGAVGGILIFLVVKGFSLVWKKFEK